MGINRGSEWRKWDLHVHTPATLCSEYGGDKDEIWEKYFKELERISTHKNIKVLGINDYLFLDGYKKVLKYKQDGGLRNVELLLPVVEFRLKEFVGSRELGRINYHIIFADESILPINQIETHFLLNLRGKGNLDVDCPDYATWGGIITRETLIDLGQHIISHTPEDKRTNANPIDVGFNNLNFELSKISDILGEGSEPNTFLRNKYFKAIGKAEWESFRWEGSALGKKTIINSTHFIFSASPTIKQANEGLESLKKQGVNSRLLHCSDAHGFANDVDKSRPKELGHCFTWIKAQPTFEGLKQIIFEPEERVRIQQEMPESDKADNLMIEKITISSSNQRFTPESIYFNKNLNVIVGGKSSGKSILLFNIAKTLFENQHNQLLKFKDTDDNFKEKDLYNLSLDDPNFDFKVQTYLGIAESIKRNDKNTSILPSIKYIPQNHLSNLVDKSKRNSNELKKYIRNLILEEPKYDKLYGDFKDKLKQNDKIRENDITEYFTFKSELKKKKDELQQKGDRETIKKTIKVLEGKVAETSKGMSEEETTEYNTLNKEYSDNEKYRNSLLSDLEKITNFSVTIKPILIELKAKKTLLLENLELDEIRNNFEPKLSFIEDVILKNETLIEMLSKDENNIFQILENNIFSVKLIETESNLKDLESKLEPFNKLFENQQLVKGFQKSISEEKMKLSDIEQTDKEINNIQKTATERKEKIFTDIRNNRKLYDDLLSNFEGRIIKIKEEDPELNIEGKIFFNFQKYREVILDLSHGSSKSYKEFEIFNEENKVLKTYDFENYIQDLKSVFHKIENDQYKLLQNVSRQEAITKIIDQKYFFDHWDITYKKDTIHKMSTGKASLVLLKVMIKLSNIKGPILIDQPEDNLDNRSVTNELVEYLKEKKKERQIILVTHNANIVVNADAENIIIANQKGQSDDDQEGSPYEFDYINGALEDINPLSTVVNEKDLLKSMSIRDHITQIVEGGKDAFKKREKKYGF